MTINQTDILVKELSIVCGYGMVRRQNSTLRRVQSEIATHPASYPLRTRNSTWGDEAGA
jgi:hypothetical protein